MSGILNTPKELIELVERFDRNKDSYISGQYNETQVRREFVDPFFALLGWDIENKQGFAEAYKDVIHEDAIKIGTETKAPDYCFRIGGTRKFFLEAKRPSVNLKDDISPAFQLRRYAWSAKLPLSILTDFKEFVVYDTRIKPSQTDKPSIGRIMYLTYQEYIDKWEQLVNTFSKDAIQKGSFDKYAETNKGKKGTTEVDTAFLEEIELWRKTLAQNLALRNPKLTQRELNFSVQRTLDRIIFLRICEDRGIEPYGKLRELLKWEDVYSELCNYFQRADERYNSGLFHFTKEKDRSESPDELTLHLKIEDKLLKDIIKKLYYPEPYAFSVIPADILGQIYEQFLGKVIHLTDGHRAVVEDKPEVKKAGGVYYTPTYIVDYIVKNTVGNLLGDNLVENNSQLETRNSKLETAHTRYSPKQVSKLRILDPACGSGSFLLGAYQYLLDWHLKYYTTPPNSSPSLIKEGARGWSDWSQQWASGKSPAIHQTATGGWRLTTQERKRILLNNIYGVDIDTQAVEVTKLSLLLKVLEGESELRLFHNERALPDLGKNIKCGNSLIGPNFYDNQQLLLIDEEEKYRINVFDWNIEFPDIIKSGGFDAIIGNPPYVRQESLGDLKDYFESRYKVFHGIADLYVYFIEKAVSLLKKDGYFSFIVANKWFRTNYGEPLRNWLKKQNIEEIIDFGDLPVFQQATTYPCILRIRNNPSVDKFLMTQVKSLDFKNLYEYVAKNQFTVKNMALDDKGWILSNENIHALLNKLKLSGISLEKYTGGNIFRGIITGLNEAFVIDNETKNKLIAIDKKSKELIKPFLIGREIKKYQFPSNNLYLIFIPNGWSYSKTNGKGNAWLWFEKLYPAIAKHLLGYSDLAKKRCDQGEYWW